MFFKKKKPKRLYYPTKSRWYRRPRKHKTVRSSRKIFSHNIRIHFTRLAKDAFWYLVIGGIFIVLIVFLLFSSKFSIEKIDVVRDDLNVNSSAITELLSDFKGKSIFAFSKNKARNLIQERYPEFADVKVKKLLPNTIKIELERYAVVANIRTYYVLPKVENPPLSEEDEELLEINTALETAFDLESDTETIDREEITPIEQKALLNRIGQAIFDQEENLELMTVTIDGLSQPIQDREIVIPKESMDYILDSIKYFLNIMQSEIVSVRFLPIAREIHLTTENDTVLWLTTEKSYKEQINKFQAAALNEENIAYVDLRIQGEVIYCPRTASCAR